MQYNFKTVGPLFDQPMQRFAMGNYQTSAEPTRRPPPCKVAFPLAQLSTPTLRRPPHGDRWDPLHVCEQGHLWLETPLFAPGNHDSMVTNSNMCQWDVSSTDDVLTAMSLQITYKATWVENLAYWKRNKLNWVETAAKHDIAVIRRVFLLREAEPLLVRLGGAGNGMIRRTTKSDLTRWVVSASEPVSAQVVEPRKYYLPGSKPCGNSKGPFPTAWRDVMQSIKSGILSAARRQFSMLGVFAFPWLAYTSDHGTHPEAFSATTKEMFERSGLSFQDMYRDLFVKDGLRRGIQASIEAVDMPGMFDIDLSKDANPYIASTMCAARVQLGLCSILREMGLFEVAFRYHMMSNVRTWVSNNIDWLEAWFEALEYAPAVVTSTWFFFSLFLQEYFPGLEYNQVLRADYKKVFVEALQWYGIPGSIAERLTTINQWPNCRSMDPTDHLNNLRGRRTVHGFCVNSVFANVQAGPDKVRHVVVAGGIQPGVDALLDLGAQAGLVVGKPEDYAFKLED